jgi:beta-lactamase class A
MKKVVNGQVYDTDMAATVTSWKEESQLSGVKVTANITLNRKYVLKDGVTPDEALEVTSWGGISVNSNKIDQTRGEFFLSIKSGSWDEEANRIIPVSDDQAKEIVEKRGSFEDYVRWFGDPRGIAVTPDAVKKAVETQRLTDYEEKSKVVKERDAAKARVSELENRILELENR